MSALSPIASAEADMRIPSRTFCGELRYANAATSPKKIFPFFPKAIRSCPTGVAAGRCKHFHTPGGIQFRQIAVTVKARRVSVIVSTRRADHERIERAKIRKVDAMTAVIQSVHAAATLAKVLAQEIARQGDREGKSLRVKRSARHLDQALDTQLLILLLTIG